VSGADDLSRAIVLYIGFGSESWPGLREDRVVAAFGEHVAAPLLAQVRALLAELSSLEIDRGVHSLASGGDEARREMARRHPELSEAALDALAWKFSYDWK
jgi:hypothetical protein